MPEFGEQHMADILPFPQREQIPSVESNNGKKFSKGDLVGLKKDREFAFREYTIADLGTNEQGQNFVVLQDVDDGATFHYFNLDQLYTEAELERFKQTPEAPKPRVREGLLRLEDADTLDARRQQEVLLPRSKETVERFKKDQNIVLADDFEPTEHSPDQLRMILLMIVSELQKSHFDKEITLTNTHENSVNGEGIIYNINSTGGHIEHIRNLLDKGKAKGYFDTGSTQRKELATPIRSAELKAQMQALIAQAESLTDSDPAQAAELLRKAQTINTQLATRYQKREIPKPVFPPLDSTEEPVVALSPSAPAEQSPENKPETTELPYLLSLLEDSSGDTSIEDTLEMPAIVPGDTSDTAPMPAVTDSDSTFPSSITQTQEYYIDSPPFESDETTPDSKQGTAANVPKARTPEDAVEIDVDDHDIEEAQVLVPVLPRVVNAENVVESFDLVPSAEEEVFNSALEQAYQATNRAQAEAAAAPVIEMLEKAMKEAQSQQAIEQGPPTNEKRTEARLEKLDTILHDRYKKSKIYIAGNFEQPDLLAKIDLETLLGKIDNLIPILENIQDNTNTPVDLFLHDYRYFNSPTTVVHSRGFKGVVRFSVHVEHANEAIQTFMEDQEGINNLVENIVQQNEMSSIFLVKARNIFSDIEVSFDSKLYDSLSMKEVTKLTDYSEQIRNLIDKLNATDDTQVERINFDTRSTSYLTDRFSPGKILSINILDENLEATLNNFIADPNSFVTQ